MRLNEAIDTIEGCASLEELRSKYQVIVESFGFSSYAFVDVGNPQLDAPFAIPTREKAWVEEYLNNGFVHVDPVLSVVRRRNTPFTWSDLPFPSRTGRRKSGALKTMEAARDHGFRDGLVIPFHFVDKMGRANSASCVLFWRDDQKGFGAMLRTCKNDLHVLMIYWAQRVVELCAQELGRRNRLPDRAARVDLTDRERTALEWAARGKTMAETAVIMSIGEETVETHCRNAMRKLDAVNKTQAVVRAITSGLINV